MGKSLSIDAAVIQQTSRIVRQDTWPPALLALSMRMGLFIITQVVVGLIFAVGAHPEPFEASIRWWPLSAAVANLLCLGALTALSHRQGRRLLDLYRVGKHSIPREILVSLGLMVIGTPLALLPNLLLGSWLFGDVARTGDLLLRPLPAWGLLFASVLFPLTNAITELPTYFAYAMPRIERLSGRAWVAVLLSAFFLAAQHIALPLTGDMRFIVWRLGMFAPFALFVGLSLRRRPTLLPYFMVLHGLMDLQLILMIPAL